MKPVLKATKISKRFSFPTKVTVLNDINLEVNPGETIAIMGRSGEGKSTLLNILGTLDSPSDGTLEIAGAEVTSFNRATIRNKNIAFIFQSFHLLDECTALENVLLPATIGRQSVKQGSAAYNRGVELLHLVGLKDRVHFNTNLLSGGEKQRVAIARALCNDPDLILADEPTGNLDNQTADCIHDLLIQFAKNQKKALVIVTHDPKLASLCEKQYQLSDHILRLL